MIKKQQVSLEACCFLVLDHLNESTYNGQDNVNIHSMDYMVS